VFDISGTDSARAVLPVPAILLLYVLVLADADPVFGIECLVTGLFSVLMAMYVYSSAHLLAWKV
jgi:hypothetical protein